MFTHIGLIRGINVGGNQLLPMSALREMMASIGFGDARTMLQSGNVVFNGGRRKADALERLLEREITKHASLTVDVLIRTADEWRSVIERNPFPHEAERDPSHTLVMFFKANIGTPAVESLRASIVGKERMAADGKQLYVVYPDGIGTSKLTGTRIEKTLAARGTARNWNTITKLAALVSTDDSAKRD